MNVAVAVDASGAKHFRILEMQGPSAVRKLVFQRMLDTEALTSQHDARDSPLAFRRRIMRFGSPVCKRTAAGRVLFSRRLPVRIALFSFEG